MTLSVTYVCTAASYSGTVEGEGSTLPPPSQVDPRHATRETPPEQLRRYIKRHPEWPETLILIARETDGHALTIWTVADLRRAEQYPEQLT